PLPVYGTLSEPIHALNIDERLNEIKKLHPNAHIIGIDACLGNEEDIGDIRVRNHAISPGKGVGKELPEVGETSIIGIVDTSEYSDLFFSRSIRLSFVMDMAKSISKILFDSCLINKKELVS
ncbi:spore protease YyaC, partial [Clostridium neonatale]